MGNSYEEVKSKLHEVINDQDLKVIVLKGKWGTGKTHLWDSFEKEIRHQCSSPRTVYISIFGTRKIDDLKLKLFINAYSKKLSLLQAIFQTIGRIINKAINFFTKSSAEDIFQLWIPKLLKNRLVVIDDIERMNPALDVDELLGLIDEYSEAYKCRFLLLLNTNKLGKNQVIWDTLHEKVIDAEILLDPTSIEALNIVFDPSLHQYQEDVEKALVILKVNNIRVIQRIIKVIKVIEATVNLGEVETKRWLPSLVLLTALHYKAIDNPPTLDYLFSFNSMATKWSEPEGAEKEVEWESLLDNLEIPSFDEFEKIIQNYLEAGALETDRLVSVFEGYQQYQSHLEADNKVNSFIDDVRWNPNKSIDELVTEALEFKKCIEVINPSGITLIHKELVRLEKPDIAKDLLSDWLSAADKRPDFKTLEEENYRDEWHDFLPEVTEKMEELRDKMYPPLSVAEAIKRMIYNPGYGKREEIALGRATVADYQAALSELSGGDLRRFLREHIKWVKHPGGRAEFTNASEKFLQACQSLYNANPQSRMATILLDAFTPNEIAERLVGAQEEQSTGT